jgi:pre-mRNA-processing factor 17
MDLLLEGYNSASSEDDEEGSGESAPAPVAQRPDRRLLNSAPTPSILAGRGSGAMTLHKQYPTANDPAGAAAAAAAAAKPKGGALVLMNNPKKSTLYEPIQGPQAQDPNSRALAKPIKPEANVHVDETTFHEQRTTFQRTGRAQAPDAEGTVITRTTLGYDPKRLEYFEQQAEQARKRPRFEGKDALVEGSDDEAVYGVWGPPSREETWNAENALSDVQKGVELAPEQIAEREYIAERNRQKGLEEEQEKEPDMDRLVERKMSHLLPPRLQGDDHKPMEPSTAFHGDEEFDYKGNSWIAPPAGLGTVGHLDMDHHKCFIPKKCVHRFTGHNQGVHRIRLFPKTGHLLLSAGLDGKCKVWSVEKRKVMRTYVGHSAAVRDVQFNHDGTKFVSASFDRYLRLWNTETGQVLQTFTNRRVPYVVKFYPHDDNFFVVGCSDNKIVTYDATTAEITQEYNHHLGPVNSIIFVEDHGTKMITSSDDKKVLVWEWDIGVPIKYISDPTMHSMPCLAVHPAGLYFAGQSLDNQIAVFQAKDRFALQRKKKYTGHQVSGYACELTFSPDGQFLVSGDGNGKIFFWAWKGHRILQKYRGHDKGPTTGVVWHPLEPSTLFTCGWDGVIKMWQ